MKPYKGIIRISCEFENPCFQKKLNMQADCMACQYGLTQVIDLEEKILHESRALALKPKKTAKKKAPEKAPGKSK